MEINSATAYDWLLKVTLATEIMYSLQAAPKDKASSYRAKNIKGPTNKHSD